MKEPTSRDESKESEYCIYCGYPLVDSVKENHIYCEKEYKPFYLNDYEMANLIGMYVFGSKLELIGGDGAEDIGHKLQQWCKRYGFPKGNNLRLKIDETTFDDRLGIWLMKIRGSAPQRVLEVLVKHIQEELDLMMNKKN